MPYNFAHYVAYDTNRIRAKSGYKEVIPYRFALERTLERARAHFRI